MSPLGPPRDPPQIPPPPSPYLGFTALVGDDLADCGDTAGTSGCHLCCPQRRGWRAAARGEDVGTWGCGDTGVWGQGDVGDLQTWERGDGNRERTWVTRGRRGCRDTGTSWRPGRRGGRHGDGGTAGPRGRALLHLGRGAPGRPRCPDRRRSIATSSGTISPGRCGAAPGGAARGGGGGQHGNAGTRWGCGARGWPSRPVPSRPPPVSPTHDPPAPHPAAGSGSDTAQEMAVGGGKGGGYRRGKREARDGGEGGERWAVLPVPLWGCSKWDGSNRGERPQTKC